MNTITATNQPRHGVTLIELLLVMGLIGFMAGMLTFALMGAQTDARVARTRGTIQKLNEIILQQWEEYRYRAVDLRKGTFYSGSNQAVLNPRQQAFFRMLILRDTMRMEMPDRISDLVYGPSYYMLPNHLKINAMEVERLEDRAVPHKFGILYQALGSALQNSSHSALASTLETLNPSGVYSHSTPGDNPLITTASIAAWDQAVQSSELLYLIVATSNEAGTPALELLRSSEIGDPDGDGLLEFIDAWGNPIYWIRWPAGFPSDLNRYADPDALDPLKTDWRFRQASGFTDDEKPQTIVPLIASAGPDENFGIRFEFFEQNNPVPKTVYAMMMQAPSAVPYVDPFFTAQLSGVPSPYTPNGDVANLNPFPITESDPRNNRINQLGSIINQTFFTDDITNHDIILEP